VLTFEDCNIYYQARRNWEIPNFGMKEGVPHSGVTNSWEIFSPDVGDIANSRH